MQPNDDQVVLSVVDSGNGVPPEEREKIFERFYRFDPNGTKPGMGLGLPIVRGLVESCRRHGLGRGGTERGAAFRVVAPHRCRGANDRGRSHMHGRPKVLIVDDEPDVLLTLRMILESEGFDPSLAADGETALRRIDEEHPDLVVLDIMMPVLDGWFVLAELAGRNKRPGIVVCSAKSSETDRCAPASSRPTSTSPSPSSRTISSR